MSNSNGSKPKWEVLYEAASLETDREKLTELVAAVEEALVTRGQELAHDPDRAEERNAMVQASENLLAIKTEKLGYPPIRLK